MGHYFDASPGTRSKERDIELRLGDVELRLRADAGVFSSRQIDRGTMLLLERGRPLTSTGNLLDLGCGYGPIALTLARRSPNSTVWAVDVNRRAVDLCRLNADANHLDNVRVCAPDDVPPDIEFSTIWSNPPIRIGKPALHRMLLTWLGRLAVGGSAVMVVNKNLGSDSLARWLTVEHGWDVQRLTSRDGFRLLEVRRPVETPGVGG